MVDNLFKSFQLSTLCVAIAFANTAAFALEDLETLDDYELGESTGEGVAFLPENFSMRMNGPDEANQGRGTYDTGYINLIPVGPITGKDSSGLSDKNYSVAGGDVYDSNGKIVRKADVYLYGVGISQSNKNWGAARTSDDWGMGFGRAIDSWGTAINPWVIKAVSEKVHQFTSKGASGADVAYFSAEAPLYRHLTSASTNGETYNNIYSLNGPEKSAYNLRLNLWADAFMRDANVAQNITTNPYSGLDNQLRLNMVWDGFSVNGSTVKFFQTQGGVTDQPGLSKAYNQTLGLATTLRLNSMPTHNIRATADYISNPTNEWVSYDATNITYRSNNFTEAELLQLRANNFSAIGGSNKVIIADGTGNAPSGTVLWNGPVAARSTNLTTVNPANPTYNHVIRSYVPLGNSQGNNIMDDDWTDDNLAAGTGIRYTTIDGKKVPMSYRVYWNYTGYDEGIVGTLVGILGMEKTDPFLRGICGAAQGGANTSVGDSKNGPGTQCFNQEGFRIITAESTYKNNWKLPEAAKRSVLRINAQEIEQLGTPALGGGAPQFNSNPNTEANKGIFLYGLNANLVLGTLYQPLIFDTKDGNFSIELTRIPNVENVYKKIYTRYADIDPTASTDYWGSTCNIYRCSTQSDGKGATVDLNGDYQANAAKYDVHGNVTVNPATHSSITIGSTVYEPDKNQIFAYKGIESYGVSFGSLEDNTEPLEGVARRDYVQTFNTARTWGATNTERRSERTSLTGCGGFWNSDSCYRWRPSSNATSSIQAWSPTRYISLPLNGTIYNVECPTATANNPGACSVIPSLPAGATATLPDGNGTDNRAYITYNPGASSWTNPWTKTDSTTRTQNTNYQILGLKTGCLNNCGTAGVGSAIPTSFPTELQSKKTVGNNLGSAVIDGMLIQHLKITTTGLK